MHSITTGFWSGRLHPKNPGRYERPLRERLKDGTSVLTFSDDTEYHEAIRIDLVEGPNAHGLREKHHVAVRMPWRRLTPKAKRPGRGRRTRLTDERVTGLRS